MLSKFNKSKFGFKNLNKLVFVRGGDHHGKAGEHHDDHHHEEHGKWYELFGGPDYDPPRKYNLHGELVRLKKIKHQS